MTLFNPPHTTVYTYTDIIGERVKANLVVRTTQFVRTSCYYVWVRITRFFLSEMIFYTLPVTSMRIKPVRELSSIQCLTEAVPLFNLRGSKVQVVPKLGWLVQVQSLFPLAKNAMHSPTSITSFRRSILAPASTRSETMSVLQHLAANISAEVPCCVRRDMILILKTTPPHTHNTLALHYLIR